MLTLYFPIFKSFLTRRELAQSGQVTSDPTSFNKIKEEKPEMDSEEVTAESELWWCRPLQ